MPTILMILGWRFFFYTNERNEPIHVHCRKGDSEAKYWLEVDQFGVIEAHSYNMSPGDKRTVRRIIFDHFDYIVSEWNKLEEKKNE
jgi:hypothetical protein